MEKQHEYICSRERSRSSRKNEAGGPAGIVSSFYSGVHVILEDFFSPPLKLQLNDGFMLYFMCLKSKEIGFFASFIYDRRIYPNFLYPRLTLSAINSP